MIFFLVRNLLVYLLIKLLDSSCVLFFLVTIFVCWTIRNKSELKAKTGRDRWRRRTIAACGNLHWDSERKTITPFSLYLARKNKMTFLPSGRSLLCALDFFNCYKSNAFKTNLKTSAVAFEHICMQVQWFSNLPSHSISCISPSLTPD